MKIYIINKIKQIKLNKLRKRVKEKVEEMYIDQSYIYLYI